MASRKWVKPNQSDILWQIERALEAGSGRTISQLGNGGHSRNSITERDAIVTADVRPPASEQSWR